MKPSTQVTRSKGGTAERTVDIRDWNQIPDLWHVVQELYKWPLIIQKHEVDEILDTWQLCLDLRKHILNQK
jgi:hypothetical protein